jgi:hypothetical protein
MNAMFIALLIILTIFMVLRPLTLTRKKNDIGRD